MNMRRLKLRTKEKDNNVIILKTTAVVSHVGFPHPTSASYIGKLHQLLKPITFFFLRIRISSLSQTFRYQ